jgi:hypothetical protein
MNKSLYQACVGAALAVPAILAAQIPVQGIVRPTWIDVLPQQVGKVYAVGAAPLGENAAQALKQASQNARLELAIRVRATVKGETNLKSQMSMQRELGGATTASSKQQLSQDSRVATQISELTGLGIAESWTDHNGKTVYALACLDLNAAMGHLKGRLDAVRTGLPGDEGSLMDPREAAKAALRIRKGREEVARVEALASPLIEAGGDADFRTQIQSMQLDLDRRADLLRHSLTIGVDNAASLQPELVATLRAAAQQQGFGWVDGKGLLSIRVELPRQAKARQWWSTEEEADFVTAKGAMQLSLVDRTGNPRGTANLEVSGVGTAPVAATQGLMKDLRRKFDSTLDRWLADLAL